MPEYAVPYGRGEIVFHLPASAPTTVIKPVPVPPAKDQGGEVARALDQALAERPLPTEGNAVVVVSDPTRPVPNTTILPVLLSRMESAGISRERITILMASGLHIPAGEADLRATVGDDIFERYRVIPHNSRNRAELVQLGTTSRGTPIWINKLYTESQIRVLTGVIEPHQFAGFSGGAKSISVGIAGVDTVDANHAMLLDPRSQLGICQGNPVREDIEEIGDLVGADLAVNVILNNDKKIVAALAGSPREVQKAGVEISSRIAQVEVPHLFDIVIASPGGFPKDREVYQAQKGLEHATVAVREGGTIILVADCFEGSGNQLFEQWMSEAATPAEVVERLKRDGFRVGAHKAFLLARAMLKAKVMLVSDRMPLELGKKLMFEQYTTMEMALEMAFKRHGVTASIAIMPKASSTIPRVEAAS